MDKYVEHAYVINLDKDTKKWSQVAKVCADHDIAVERFPGIDGKALLYDKNDNAKQLLKDGVTPWCQNFCTPGMIGCGLSHMNVWRDMFKKGYASALIMEDDVQFKDELYQVLKGAFNELKEKEKENKEESWDILYLGCTGLCNKNRKYNSKFFTFHALKTEHPETHDKFIFRPEYPVALQAYILSRAGCEKLLKLIPKVPYHIDIAIAQKGKDMNIYACHPKVAFQEFQFDKSANIVQFPQTFNWVLSHFKDVENIPVSYDLSVTFLRLGRYQVRGWDFIFIILGILAGLCTHFIYWLNIPLLCMLIMAALEITSYPFEVLVASLIFSISLLLTYIPLLGFRGMKT